MQQTSQFFNALAVILDVDPECNFRAKESLFIVDLSDKLNKSTVKYLESLGFERVEDSLHWQF